MAPKDCSKAHASLHGHQSPELQTIRCARCGELIKNPYYAEKEEAPAAPAVVAPVVSTEPPSQEPEVDPPVENTGLQASTDDVGPQGVSDPSEEPETDADSDG